MPSNHASRFSELTDEQFKLIGKIVVEWANIEFLQKIILSRLLLNPDFIARTFTDRLSAAWVQDAIEEAIDLHRHRYRNQIIKEEILTEIKSTSITIGTARKHRNKFAHFCWSRNSDDEIFGTSFSGGLPHSKKHQNSYITIANDKLKSLYKEAYELVKLLIDIIKKLPKIEESELIRRMKAEQSTQANP